MTDNLLFFDFISNSRYVINLLEERGWSREDLQRFGYLTNNNYDEAEKQYKAYKRIH